MIDVNVSLGSWPFRKLPAEDAEALAMRLRRAGTSQAWVGSLEGLFQRDIGGANARLADACRSVEAPRLVPFGTINLTVPDWEEDVRRCHEVHKFAGIRLHPGYHGYGLTDPGFARLLALATQRGLIVQLAVMMEDERTQHPVFRAPAVDLRPLEAMIKATPGLRLVLLNAFRSLTVETAARLAQAGVVWFEIATLEGVDRVASLVEKISAERILFGSHYPLFYLEAAALKLRETRLSARVIAQIGESNAQRLLEPAR
jgi:predicted TIM-barrel fold metal-dependent hydrolase